MRSIGRRSLRSQQRLHVVAGVVLNEHREVLIARRPDHLHQGGLWEFPGGKVEADEDAREALGRELEEEIGIRVRSAERLLEVAHDYRDKSVLLDVWRVVDWIGEARGREHQEIAWVAFDSLGRYQFPDANREIIKVVQSLPR